MAISKGTSRLSARQATDRPKTSSSGTSSSNSWMNQALVLLLIVMAFVAGTQVGLSHVSIAELSQGTSGVPPPGSSRKRDSSSAKSNSALSSSSKRTSFELARQQSFGFFDDVSDYNWELMQQRARSRVNHKFPDPLKFYYEIPRWYMNNYEPDFTCGQERRLGGPGDGPKWLCDPHRLAQVASRREATGGPGCLVYSVGCGGKYHLEEGLFDLLGPICEIHVFDPGNFGKERPDLFQNKSKNMHFHKWGFRSSYDNTYQPVVDYGEFITLEDTLVKLGHKDRPIDVFKIDCEFCEWYSFRDWYKVDIRQLLVETHDLPKHGKQALEFFDGFQEQNFYLYHKEPNIHPKASGKGIEWAYIRLHPDFIKETNETVTMR